MNMEAEELLPSNWEDFMCAAALWSVVRVDLWSIRKDW
jgi:hypothetical protein